MNKPFEYVNTITAGIGMALSYVGFVFLIILAAQYGTYWHVMCCSVYGASLVILHTASTFYHGITNTNLKIKFKYFDYVGIYMLIAGTYTPIMLINLYGGLGWTIFGIVWTLAVIGIFFRVKDITPFKNYENYLYLAMGWLIIFTIKPFYESIDFVGFLLVVLGGLSFTFGIFFNIWDNKQKYFHGIWHFFVILGCGCHYFSILFYVIPYK